MVFPAPHGIMDREHALAGARAGNRWASVEMSEVAIQRCGTDTLALAYRCRASREDARTDYHAYVGSVYTLEDSEWKLAFHQHTPIETSGS